MSKYVITIRSFLLSHCQDENGLYNGYGVKNEGYFGDWKHYNEIVDTYYNKVFENMHLTIEEKDKEDIAIFKKDFCKNFYNREIGFEVWSQFQVALESELNSDCYNLLKFYNLIRNLDVEKMKETNNMTTTSDGDSSQKALVNTNPANDLSIVYDDINTASLIKYANQIQENYGKQSGKSNSVGSNTMPLFQLYNFFARLPDIESMIFNMLDDKLFMQIF